MALARLHGGPLDGQLLPLDNGALDTLILPYSETQIVYERGATPEGTPAPTATSFFFTQAQDDINPDSDGRDE